MDRIALDDVFRRLRAPFIVGNMGPVPSPTIPAVTATQIVDHLTRVLGREGFRVAPAFTLRERPGPDGRTLWEVHCSVILQLGDVRDGRFFTFAETSGAGGEVADDSVDAQEGALGAALRCVMANVGSSWRSDTGPGPASRDPSAEGDLDERWSPHRTRDQVRAERRPSESPRRVSEARPGPDPRITPAQTRRLGELATELGLSAADLEARTLETHAAHPGHLSIRQAADLVADLQLEAVRLKVSAGPAQDILGEEVRT